MTITARITNSTDTTDTDKRIAELVEDIRSRRERIAKQEEFLETAKDELRQLLEARGENWSDDEGYARLTAESTRTSYDSKALDNLILASTRKYGWLKEFRKVSTVRAALQIK